MNARPLFRIAAAFNFLVGIPMLIAYPLVARLLELEGPSTLWFDIVAAIVVVFGYAYARIAQDPVRYRPYIALGAICKMAFVAVIYGHWLNGTASGPLALLVTTDLVFALLFAGYLRTTPPSAEAKVG
jgi:hypothetical protein